MKRNVLLNKLKQYARIANNRLAKIEKQRLTQASNAYKYVERLAYDKIATKYNKNGQPRFLTIQELKKMSDKQLKKYDKEITNFLEAKTSTLGGVKRKYNKAYDTYISRYSYIPFEDFTNMYDYEILKKFQEMYGSKELNRLVSKYGLDTAIKIAKEIFQTAEKMNKEKLSLEEVEKIKERYKTYD